jgi:Xaa-Pro aminopeptidase
VVVGNGVAGERPYRRGDVLWCDFGATFNGYQADLSRRAVFGSATAADLAAHATAVATLDVMIGMMRPGVRVCDVARRAEEMMVAAGYTALQGRRIGHGLGLAAAEQPSIALHDETKLAEGMVLTPEPTMVLDTGERIHLEETVVITRDGCERLSEGAGVLHGIVA